MNAASDYYEAIDVPHPGCMGEQKA